MVGGVFTMMDISASALRAERARMNMHANNLANVNTTRDADGNPNPYRRKVIHFKSGNVDMTGSEKLGVSVDKIEDDTRTDLIYKYQPGHPDAITEGEKKGFVAYPNVQVPLEMVDMMMAVRAFEANLTAMESAKQVLRGALQIIA
jgi:flagellar basal-body rod protein FlgC